MAKLLQFPTHRVYCNPTFPADYSPARTVEQDERERLHGRDHAAAFAHRRNRNPINDDGPQAA